MMKHAAILALAFLPLSGLQAQDISRQAIEAAVEEMAQQYQLDAEQREQAFEIQQRRLRNLADIEALREDNYKLYLMKKKAVREGTQASLKRMLREGQMPVLRQQLIERRKKKAALIQQLKEEGAPQETIQLEVLKLEE